MNALVAVLALCVVVGTIAAVVYLHAMQDQIDTLRADLAHHVAAHGRRAEIAREERGGAS
jgi:hypothetical protein